MPPDGRRLAAVLACGDGAVASHGTAAGLWGLRQDNATRIHITVEHDRGHRSRPGIHIHRTRCLPEDDHAQVRCIPVTSVPRTLVDLGDTAPPTHVRSAFVQAERLRLVDMAQIDAALTGAGKRKGAGVLTELLHADDPRWSQTRSDLEIAMSDLLTHHRLPQAEVNAWVGGRYLADFLWREHSLIAVTDGAASHSTPSARRSDARRDQHLRRLGYRVLRFRYDEVLGDPSATAARLQPALAPTRPTSARPS